MTCKHRNAEGRAWSAAYPRWYSTFKARTGDKCADAIICLDCGEWLSMGHSDETPERVAIEIRAAELAALVADERAAGRRTFLSDIGFDGAEIAGWVERQYDSEKLPEQFGERAGYLARAITEETP